MKVKITRVLEECIDNGIALGLSQAHKYTDTPTEEQIRACISDAIWNEFYEWFDFEQPNGQSEE
jgi:hypothetical protein